MYFYQNLYICKSVSLINLYITSVCQWIVLLIFKENLFEIEYVQLLS